LFILPMWGPWLAVATVVMAVAIVLTIVTGIDYVNHAVKGVRGRSAGQ
jgi:CDP-diacylglycerol--glycerol-3-phosphate 3-phosphatidyltransferase